METWQIGLIILIAMFLWGIWNAITVKDDDSIL